MAWPSRALHCPKLPRAIKGHPFGHSTHHTSTAPLPFHPEAAEEQPELETERFSHRAVTPPWCVSGDATAT